MFGIYKNRHTLEGKKFALTKECSTILERNKLYVQLVCNIRELILSNTDILILSEFLSGGYNEFTKQELIRSGVVKNMANLANMLSKYRKMGIIVKNGHSEKLCKELDIELGKDVNLIQIIIKSK